MSFVYFSSFFTLRALEGASRRSGVGIKELISVLASVGTFRLSVWGQGLGIAVG